MLTPAFDQKVDNLPRIWAAIDIIAKEDLDRLRDRIGCEVGVDARQQRLQKVGPPVHVSNGIDARAIGNARFRRLDS